MPEKKEPVKEGEFQMTLFKGNEMRREFHGQEWYYSVIDAIAILTGSENPRRLWSDIKRKLIEDEGFTELYDDIVRLKLIASDGKLRETDCADTETLFRIAQSIPSKKLEPFKKWLAKVGYERIQEEQNPDIIVKRAFLTYQSKGYEDTWIQNRIQTLVNRRHITDEWQKRGIKDIQYAILTDSIHVEAFGLTTKEHKKKKQLKSHPLRDHMSTLELAIQNVGEEAAKALTIERDAQGFPANNLAAKDGGKVAGRAREEFENQTGKSIVTGQNFLKKKPEQKEM